MNKVRFVATFLLAFALLLIVWKGTQGSRWYTDALLIGAGIVGPAIHGWVLETSRNPQVLPVWIHGGNRVDTAIQFDALSVGLVPVLALLAATPGLRLRRRATLMLIGAALCFLVDMLLIALFPLLVFYKNPFTDVIGTFLGLIVFVGAPVIIWFSLTFRDLRPFLPSLRQRASQSRG